MKNRNDSKGQKKFKAKIPKGKRQNRTPLAFRDKGRWFLTGDWHVPFHDERAMEIALRFAVDNRCDHLYLNGDLLDAYQLSRWTKDPNERSTDKEIAMLAQLLAEVQSYFPGRKVYKIGNHEERIEAYLFTNAPRMIGISKWRLCDALKSELGLDDSWEFVPSKRLVTLGKHLNVYHGHELPRGLTNPVSVGRGVWLRTKSHGVTSHWHSVSTHVETDARKKKAWTCFSLGCLCDLHPSYAPVNGWSHGVAYVDLDSAGNFCESNHRIHDGRIW